MRSDLCARLKERSYTSRKDRDRQLIQVSLVPHILKIELVGVTSVHGV